MVGPSSLSLFHCGNMQVHKTIRSKCTQRGFIQLQKQLTRSLNNNIKADYVARTVFKCTGIIVKCQIKPTIIVTIINILQSSLLNSDTSYTFYRTTQEMVKHFLIIESHTLFILF